MAIWCLKVCDAHIQLFIVEIAMGNEMKSKAEFAICQNVTSIMLLMPNTRPKLSLSFTHAFPLSRSLCNSWVQWNALEPTLTSFHSMAILVITLIYVYFELVWVSLPFSFSSPLSLFLSVHAAIRMHLKLTLETFSLPRKAKTHLLFDILLLYCCIRTIRFVAQLV